MEKGTKIEHYILGKVIGEGASSRVKSKTISFRNALKKSLEIVARHEYSNTDVAIKIINKKKMKSSKMGAKIKREIRLLRYFNHPNIIRLWAINHISSSYLTFHPKYTVMRCWKPQVIYLL